MTRLFIRKINKYSECGGQGEVEVQLERSAVSTRMAGRGCGLEISATSTAPWLGVLVASWYSATGKCHEIANPSGDLLWLCSDTECSTFLEDVLLLAPLRDESRSVQAQGQCQVWRGLWCSGAEDTNRWTVMVTFNIQYFCCRGDWIWRGGQSSELFLQQDQRHYNGNVRRGTAMAWRTWTVLRDQEKSIIHA